MAGPDLLILQSHYSLREGTRPVADLVAQAAGAGARGVVLADRNSLRGVPELVRAARQHGLVALPGTLLTVVGPLGDRDELTLVATSPEGYRNLCRAVTEAHLGPGWAEAGSPGPGAAAAGPPEPGAATPPAAGDPRRLGALPPPGTAPALMVEGLSRYARGILALAGPRSEPGRLWLTGRREAAREAAARLQETFAGAVAGLPEKENPLVGVVPALDAHGLLAAYQPAFPEARPRFPRFPAPDGMTGEAYLARLAREGLAGRGLAHKPGYQERLAHELAVISRLGLAGYFLVIWDLVRHARAEGIAVGPGRGSAVGSLAAYALGITGVDPVAAGLYFERFLNPERADLPDIDLDICSRERPRLLTYLRRRWGETAVAQCGLVTTLGARGAIREAGRQLGLEPRLVDAVARLFPHSRSPGGIDAALRELPELRRIETTAEPFQGLLERARELEGRPWNVSVHAAGVVIGLGPLPDLVPLMRAGGGEIITQYPAEELEGLGLIKIDLLGLRNLTVIADLEHSLPGLDLAGQPPDDPATYRMLAAGDGIGVFQLDSPGMRRLLRQLQPERFSDLVALLALYRPGPFQAGAVAQFIRRRRGEEPVTYPHPVLREALADTYGVLVYQEQVMAIARDAAGFSLGEADDLRRALGRGPRAAAAWQERFLAGARGQGLAPRAAGAIWRYLLDHAGYSFNKAHTTAYALLAYRTAYLKAHHPARYFAALLAVESGYYAPGVYIQEAGRYGVKLLPPDPNRSGLTYQFEPPAAIRTGLLQVPGVGPAAALAILAERESRGPFAGPIDLAQRLAGRGVARGVVRALLAACPAASGPEAKAPASGAPAPGAAAKGKPASGFRREAGTGSRQLTLADFGLPGEVPPPPPPPPAPPGPEKLLHREASSAAAMAALPPGSRVVAGGIIISARRRPDQGGVGLTLLLQDQTGLIEVLVPPAVYERDLIHLDPAGVAVSGRTIGSGEARLIADRIQAVTDYSLSP